MCKSTVWCLQRHQKLVLAQRMNTLVKTYPGRAQAEDKVLILGEDHQPLQMKKKKTLVKTSPGEAEEEEERGSVTPAKHKTRPTRKPFGFMQSCFFCRRMKKKMLYFLSIEILFIKRNT